MAMMFLKIVWIIVALTYVADTQKSIWLIDEVRESNVRIINITFDDEIVSNFYFFSSVSFQCTRFCI
jgi:hypothetical protein